ncbi:MAG: hypothetical protein D6781_01680 [Verrucomicrobia bacterium]|nr:MAG: hypothetical protein D6781_01680 [Verrucomicrobiota bacterium]
MHRLTALTCALISLVAEVVAADADAIFWPAKPRPPFSVETRQEIFDAVPITVTEFVGAGIRIRADAAGSWIGHDTAGGRYSLRLTHYRNPNIKLAFSIFGPGEFLPDLGEKAWQAYLAGLRQTWGDALRDLTETNKADGTGDVFLFGKPYREVYYTVNRAPGTPPVTFRELFALVGGRLLVVTVEAPAERMPGLVLPVDRFLARLELVP